MEATLFHSIHEHELEYNMYDFFSKYLLKGPNHMIFDFLLFFGLMMYLEYF